MSVTQYYKTLKLTVVEAAVVYAALGAHCDKLQALLNGEALPEFNKENAKAELVAVEAAMVKILHARFEA